MSDIFQSSTAVGASLINGCLICTAHSRPQPRVGDRVVLLDGHRSGVTGTVSKIDLDDRFSPGTFLIRADGADPQYEQIVDRGITLFVLTPNSLVLPDWFPPFSLRECVELHSVIISFINRCLGTNGWNWRRIYYYEVIRFCWFQRLPLTPAEVWQILKAHGVPSACEGEAQRLFLEGTELLVYVNGRRPIKKKRKATRRTHLTHRSVRPWSSDGSE